jgi:hypothetical protein
MYAMTELCQCGCGQPAPIAPHNNRSKGWVKGEPRPFCNGHNGRKALRYVEQDCGYSTPCWVWQMSRTTGGYGQTFDGTRLVPAHRWYYERTHGLVPEGLDLDHLCRVRACVNPDHLEPVTRRENLLRGETRTAANAAKTHCPQGHPYDEVNTYVRASGQRVCRRCNAIRNNAAYHRRRELEATS